MRRENEAAAHVLTSRLSCLRNLKKGITHMALGICAARGNKQQGPSIINKRELAVTNNIKPTWERHGAA